MQLAEAMVALSLIFATWLMRAALAVFAILLNLRAMSYRTWVLLCSVTFGVAMYGLGKVITWGLAVGDWWFLIPWLFGWLLIAYRLDSRRKAEEGD